jgi:hypothetical protein
MAKTVQIVEPKLVDAAFTERSISNDLVIAGTSKGLYFFGAKQHVELEGKCITALASSASDLWAVVDRHVLWHRNSNSDWHIVASVDDLQLNCILPVEENVFAGTTEALLVNITNERVEKVDSFNSLEGRNEWYTPWGGPPALRSMAVSQSGTIYANVHVGGILRSDDRGQSWQPTIDLHADVHEVQVVPSRPDLVIAATARGLAMSIDRGESWRFDRVNLHAAYSRAIAVCDEMILMTTSVGPSGGKAALYRRLLDESGSFEKCNRGLPEWFSGNIDTGNLAALGKKAAFGTRDGQIFVSEDAGSTWQQIASGFGPIRCLSFSSETIG